MMHATLTCFVTQVKCEGGGGGADRCILAALLDFRG